MTNKICLCIFIIIIIVIVIIIIIIFLMNFIYPRIYRVALLLISSRYQILEIRNNQRQKNNKVDKIV